MVKKKVKYTRRTKYNRLHLMWYVKKMKVFAAIKKVSRWVLATAQCHCHMLIDFRSNTTVRAQSEAIYYEVRNLKKNVHHSG